MRTAGSLALAFAALAVARADSPYTDPEITPDEAKHWAFVAPKRPPVPAVKAAAWVRTPVDAFVLAKLEAANVTPAPEADRRTLVRRLYFDLIGLPPTPDELASHLADPAPDAFEKLVETLLASPHYGERWGRHWLDVVRFAETNGYEADGERPQAWRYRDYVIRSFNADKPYSEFVREQIAGDLIAGKRDPKDVPDLFVATGLHRCGPVHMVSGNLDPAIGRQEVLTEMVTGVGSGVLGLTVACARCHDHKFDPISLGDYYRLQAFFAGTKFRDVSTAPDGESLELGRQLALFALRIGPVKKAVLDLEAPYRKALLVAKKAALDPATREAVETDSAKRTPGQKKLAELAGPRLKIAWDEVVAALSPEDREKRAALKDRQRQIEAEFPRLPAQAWAVGDDAEPPPTHVLKRGDVRRKSVSVNPAVPRVVAGGSTAAKTRLDLADWLVRPDHPLTARVIVNRLWKHHFGRGIVGTPNDFGTRGDSPSHPELLDWLAVELVNPTWGPDATADKAWTLKRLHRLMVLSAAYRQASRPVSTGDPDNKLFGRQNRRRLEAEAIRDAMLTASGALNRELGGASVKVPLEPEVYDLIFTEGEPDGLWTVTPDPKQHARRSVYLFVKRNVRLPLLEAFDQPDALNPCAARGESTFAPQALILMNGPDAHAQAKALAADVLRTGTPSPEARVEAVFRRALSRPPTADEVRACVAFLAGQADLARPRLAARKPVGIPLGLPPAVDPADARALADLALAVFNMNEFVTVP